MSGFREKALPTDVRTDARTNTTPKVSNDRWSRDQKFKFEKSYYFGPLVKICGFLDCFCSFKSRFGDFSIFNKQVWGYPLDYNSHNF